METIMFEVIGGLIVAIIVALFGFFGGRLFEKERYNRRHETALSAFSTNLGDAIMKPLDDDMAVAQARIIVSIRDSSKNELSNVARLLNSDIDKLSTLIQEADGFAKRGQPVPIHIRGQISETIKVLKGTWSSKKQQIDVAIRKLLAELGLVEGR